MTKGYTKGDSEGIMGKVGGVVEEWDVFACRGNTSRRRVDAGSYLECRRNGSREIGGWVRYRQLILATIRYF